MGVIGEVRRARCDICEKTADFVGKLPAGWHSFNAVDRTQVGGPPIKRFFCAECWAYIWPHIRSVWYKLHLVQTDIADNIRRVQPDKDVKYRRGGAQSLSCDIVRDAVDLLDHLGYLMIDGGSAPTDKDDEDFDCLHRCWGDGPSAKEKEGE